MSIAAALGGLSGPYLESSLGQALSGIMPSFAGRLRRDSASAGLRFSEERILASCLVMSVVFAALSFAVSISLSEMDNPLPFAFSVSAIAAALGWFVPARAVSRAAAGRREEISKALPFAIDMIGSAIRSGLDFGAAVRYYVGVGVGGALDEELSLALQDVSLGRPFQEALSRMAERVRVESVTAFVSVVSYGMEIGASISRTLRLHGGELRRSRFALAERKAQRAPIVMILPLVLFIMPAVFIVVLTPMVLRLMGTFRQGV